MKLSISVPDTLAEEIREEAWVQRKSLSKLISELVAQHLREKEGKKDARK